MENKKLSTIAIIIVGIIMIFFLLYSLYSPLVFPDTGKTKLSDGSTIDKDDKGMQDASDQLTDKEKEVCPERLFLSYIIENKNTSEVTDDDILISAAMQDLDKEFDMIIFVDDVEEGTLNLRNRQRATLLSETITRWWRSATIEEKTFMIKAVVPGCRNINYGFTTKELLAEKENNVALIDNAEDTALYEIGISGSSTFIGD